MSTTRQDLQELQRVPLKYKEMLSADKIRELMRFVGYDSERVYVSLSGGKDSCCLCDLTAHVLSELGYKRMYALYVHTGLEYSSVRSFIQPFLDSASEKHHIDIVLDVRTPKRTFKEVIEQYGYPVISKEVAQIIEEARKGISNADGTYQRSLSKVYGTLLDSNGDKSRFCADRYKWLLDAPFKVSKHCCPITKQEPAKAYEKETQRIPIIGTLCEESQLRTSKWIRFGGCNAFSCQRPQSAPLSFWTENDILAYHKVHGLDIAKPYGRIVEETDPKNGHFEGQISLIPRNEDEIRWKTTGASRTGCIFCLFSIQTDPQRIIRLQNSSDEADRRMVDFALRGGKFDENGMWGPSEKGLGLWFVCDYLTENGIPVPFIDRNYRQDWAEQSAA